MSEIRLEAVGGESLDQIANRLDRLEREFDDVAKAAKRAGSIPVDFKTEPAEQDLARLIREFRTLERAFEAAQRRVNFAEVRNEISRTEANTKSLANAQRDLAARGEQIIQFARRLPPELRQSSAALDRVEKETGQAATAFRRLEKQIREASDAQKRFRATTAKLGDGIKSLISAINGLRAGLAGFIAILGVGQIARFARAIFDMGRAAIETKIQFDKLIPGLRAFTGSTELAEEVAGRLAQTADRLKVPLAGLVDPFVAIQAGGREAGLTIAEINKLFEASLVSARAFGKGAEAVQRLLTGISQVAGKGVFCVTPDVQILTSAGWRFYHHLRPGQTIVKVVDLVTGEPAWQCLQEIFVFDVFEMPAMRFRAGRADCIMSANHRVIRRHSSTLGVANAADLASSGPFDTVEYVERTSSIASLKGSVVEAGLFTGRLWCPSTEAGTWVAKHRKTAFVTGNSMEELRQQIGEAIPNAIPALAAGLSTMEGRLVTTAETIARVSSASLGSAKGLRALTIGFEQLNAAAAAGQADTLIGDLGLLERKSEDVRRAFADGLEPGLRAVVAALTAFIDNNEETVQALGAVAGAALKPAENLLRLVDAARQLASASESTKRRTQGLFDGLAAFTQLHPGLDVLADPIRNIGRAFTGTTAEARAAFEVIEDRAQQLALGSKQTAEEILENFRKSFREQAKAAGAADQEIEQSAKELAAAVGKISEESVKQRQALEELRVRAHGQGTEEIQAIERAISERLLEIKRSEHEARQKLLEESVESVKRATEQRLALEEEAAAKSKARSEEIIQAAQTVAEERIRQDELLATKREQIEQEANERILEAQQKFLEAVAKPKADRVKIEQELADQVVAIQRDAAEKMRAEEERLAEAAEREAERRAKAEERVQKARQRSIDQLVDLRDRLEEIAGGEEEASALGQLGKDAEELSEDLDDVRSSLGDLILTLDEINQATAADPLANLGGDPRSGANAANFFAGLGQGAEAAADEVLDFSSQLESALDAAQDLSGGAQEAILQLIDRYADLAASGTATREDFQSFSDELTTIGAQLGTSFDDPAAQIRQRVEEIRQSQEEAATAAQDTAQTFEEAGNTADVAWDPISKTLSSVEEAADGAGQAAEEAAQRIERGADGITITNEALEKTRAAGEAAAEGYQKVGDAAEQAAANVAAVSSAAEPLKDQILGEGEAEKVQLFGEAAGLAAPPVQLLADAANIVAEASTVIGTQLPLIQAALPEIQTTIAAILETIGSSDVDFAELGQNLGAMQEPLAAISASLDGINAATEGLPDKIQALQDAAAPLFERVLEAADDQRFDRIAQGLVAMDVAAQRLPAPLERIAEALVSLADRKDDLEAALEAARIGLQGIASEEILAALDDLIDRLEGFKERLSIISTTSTSLLATWKEIDDLVPGLTTKIRQYGEALSLAATAQDETRDAGEELAETLGLVRDEASAAVTEVNRFGDESTAAVERLNAALQTTVELLNSVTEAAEQASEATSNISIGDGG